MADNVNNNNYIAPTGSEIDKMTNIEAREKKHDVVDEFMKILTFVKETNNSLLEEQDAIRSMRILIFRLELIAKLKRLRGVFNQLDDRIKQIEKDMPHVEEGD
jgi:hypothetical protein